MKFKLFSILALLVAVLFVGNTQATEVHGNDQPAIEQVISLDNLSSDQVIPQYEIPQVLQADGTIVTQTYDGDTDHQLITHTIIEHAAVTDLDRHRPYLARSNLCRAGMFA